MLAFQQLAIAAEPPRESLPVAGLDPAVAIRTLILSGCTTVEAGNLVAFSHGLQPVLTGWTAHQIQHVLFLRLLVGVGRIEP